MFQTLIPSERSSFKIGDVVNSSSIRSHIMVVDSAGNTSNKVGKLFTYDPADKSKSIAGGTGAIAGIGINSNNLANYGNLRSMDPSLSVPDGDVMELITFGEIAVQLIETTADIGDPLYYVQATGEIGAGTPPAGSTAIPNAKVSYYDVTSNLAIITLTEIR